MPRHDPIISRDMLWRGHRLPMRRRHILNPPHPNGIIDMAKLVNVGRGGGEDLNEGGHRQLPWEQAANSPVNNTIG